MEKQKKDINFLKVMGYILLFVSIFLILLGIIVMINTDNYFTFDGNNSDDNHVDEVEKSNEFSYGGITLKKVSGYNYEVFAESIRIFNDKNSFVLGGVMNYFDDDIFDGIVSGDYSSLDIIDSGSLLLSNGKKLNYIIYLMNEQKSMGFYYNVLDTYTLIGNVISDDYEAVIDEFVVIFDDIKIDSSIVLGGDSDNGETFDEEVGDDSNIIDDSILSGELEIKDNSVEENKDKK